MAPGASVLAPELDAIPAEGAGEVPASPGWQADAHLLWMKPNTVNY